MKQNLTKIVRIRLSDEILGKIPAKNISAFIREAVLERLQNNEETKITLPF